MPELPEIEILKRSLNKNIKSSKITKIKINNVNLRYKVPKNLNYYLKGRTIRKISRVSKYLIFHFNSKKKLLVHLGMSGTIHLIIKKNTINTNASFYTLSSRKNGSFNLPKKHNHVEISLNNNSKIVYNDPRRFGYLRLLNKNFLLEPPFNKLGPEPLSHFFNYLYIKEYIKNKKKKIKDFLMDQSFVSGIGNIYANEILFHCNLNPSTSVSKLKKENILDIIKNSKMVLTKAILFGGSSIRDFKKIDGKTGKFQQIFKVYDRENMKCRKIRCLGIIQKMVISNRSSFFCTECQK